MKIYEWDFKGRTGTLTANNAKEAKEQLVVILRGKNDKSTRVPKGAKLKKIGLTKGKAVVAPEVVAAAVTPIKSKNSVDTTKGQKPKGNTRGEIEWSKAEKGKTFSNCLIRVREGTIYASDHIELTLPKGTEYCKMVWW